jgi:hypothetical protein
LVVSGNGGRTTSSVSLGGDRFIGNGTCLCSGGSLGGGGSGFRILGKLSAPTEHCGGITGQDRTGLRGDGACDINGDDGTCDIKGTLVDAFWVGAAVWVGDTMGILGDNAGDVEAVGTFGATGGINGEDGIDGAAGNTGGGIGADSTGSLKGIGVKSEAGGIGGGGRGLSHVGVVVPSPVFCASVAQFFS